MQSLKKTSRAARKKTELKRCIRNLYVEFEMPQIRLKISLFPLELVKGE